jgi:hypothetical protein
MEHLGKVYHDGLVMFLRDDLGPHHLFVPGFSFDLFVGPGGPIATGQILDSQHDEATPEEVASRAS